MQTTKKPETIPVVVAALKCSKHYWCINSCQLHFTGLRMADNLLYQLKPEPTVVLLVF